MRHGAIAILPLAFGASLYGFAFGILAYQAGFMWWGVGLMGATVHAGSSQIVAVDQFSGGSAMLAAALAGAALNLRYIGMIASLHEVLGEKPFWQRLLAIHITSDENWALTMSSKKESPDIGADFLIGSGLTMFLVWVCSTTLGALAGNALPDLDEYGLGFAFTAAFIAMARSMWPGMDRLPSWTISFAATLLLSCQGMAAAYAIVGGTLCGITMLLFERYTKDKIS
nr:AzlC family ABC transporter permease [Kushneria aurantia]